MTDKILQGVAINPLAQIHYLDHIVPIASIMNIPLLCTQEDELAIAKKFYPDVIAHTVDYTELSSPAFLIEHFDVLFLSDLWDRFSFEKTFEMLSQELGKTIRHVHCPHGFSDKGYYLQKAAFEDIVLVYGPHMLDQFKQFGVFEFLHSYVVTGNFRYTYFKMHRNFYDQLIHKEILEKFAKHQQIILYAPTWNDTEGVTSFFEVVDNVIGRIPDSYNLIVKFHPNLEWNDPVRYQQILNQYGDKPNVLFLKDFPIVYPLLSLIDIYLGDMSAVGYDFLTFNKPMFFLPLTAQSNAYLYQCGTVIQPDQRTDLYKIIDHELNDDSNKFAKIRKEAYEYTFGCEKPFEKIKEEILKACLTLDSYQSTL